MKKKIICSLLFLSTFVLFGCSNTPPEETSDDPNAAIESSVEEKNPDDKDLTNSEAGSDSKSSGSNKYFNNDTKYADVRWLPPTGDCDFGIMEHENNQKIIDKYGVTLLTAWNGYIGNLRDFKAEDYEDIVLEYARKNYPEWSYSAPQYNKTKYDYYENGILSGEYAAFKYTFEKPEDEISDLKPEIYYDPVYERLLDCNKDSFAYYMKEIVHRLNTSKSWNIYINFWLSRYDSIFFAPNVELDEAIKAINAYDSELNWKAKIFMYDRDCFNDKRYLDGIDYLYCYGHLDNQHSNTVMSIGAFEKEEALVTDDDYIELEEIVQAISDEFAKYGFIESQNEDGYIKTYTHIVD